MFILLTRVLLWLVVGIIVYTALTQWLSEKWRAGLGTALILFVAIGSFYNPTYWCVPYLWEIIAFFLKPLGLAMTLIWVAISKIDKGSTKTLLRAAFLILLVSSIPFLAHKLVHRVECEWVILDNVRKNIVPTEPKTIKQKAGAIVLMGQGTTQSPTSEGPRLQLKESSDRIIYAAELYHKETKNPPPYVIVSAGIRANANRNDESTKAEAWDIKDLLKWLGVPDYEIELDTRGTDIRTSAVAVRKILEVNQIANEPVLVVTSALKMRRTALSFMNVGINVISKPTDFYTSSANCLERAPSPPNTLVISTTDLSVRDFIPSADALVLTTKAIDELLGLIYYFLRGWLSPTVL